MDDLGSDLKIEPTHFYALPVGSRLHEFEIESVLGAGGFGITYRARDLNLDHVVAIKEYLPNEFVVRASDSTVRAKSTSDIKDFRSGLDAFLNEARTLAYFHHPNIVRVLRFFEMNGTAYLVLQYEAGRMLAQVLEEAQPDNKDVRELLQSILDGLEVVRDRGSRNRTFARQRAFDGREAPKIARHFQTAGRSFEFSHSLVGFCTATSSPTTLSYGKLASPS